MLIVSPKAGLWLMWGLAVPLLPALFLIAPGLWRNVCPIAALNQTPRVFGFTRGLTLPAWLREYGLAVSSGVTTLSVRRGSLAYPRATRTVGTRLEPIPPTPCRRA